MSCYVGVCDKYITITHTDDTGVIDIGADNDDNNSLDLVTQNHVCHLLVKTF